MSGGLLCKHSMIKWSNHKDINKKQEKHDIMVDKLSVKEYEDPFKG